MTRGWLGWWLLTTVIVIGAQETTNPSPESLFRDAVQQWRSPQGYQYQPWNDFAAQIQSRFDQEEPVTSASADSQTSPRLEWIGALEESILMIEKSTLHEGVHPKRDAALSNLYSAYGNTLQQLSAVECHMLALDPHTLLIGAETVKAAEHSKSEATPSIHLCVENAENSLRNAVTLDATNTGAQTLLDSILKEDSGVHQRKPKEFVAELFDSFAEHFDDKLLKGLNYQVPMLVGDVVQSLAQKANNKQKYQHALDAGCGTGLAGRFLRPFVAEQLIGVDASQKMLDIAAKCTLSKGCGLDIHSNITVYKNRPLYDGLLAMDLESMTVANTLLPYYVGKNSADDGFDLVVAADVLVYFGSLDSIIQTFREVSVPGSLLVFSCERTTPAEAPLGFRLLPSGRFAHTREHVQEAANKVGYQLKRYQEIVPRQEKGEDVLGHLFAFELVAENKRKEDGIREEL